ncbi:MAG: class F sortase [Caldilineaceae bacterium]
MTLVLAVGCQTMPSTAANLPDAAAVAAETSTVTTATTITAASANTDTIAARAATTVTDESMPPVRLAIPAIDFATTVEPMAWRVTEVEGERQAVWEVPEAAAGWHINSATAGSVGNMLISGHHLSGAAVFAPLARGEVATGDEIQVTDSAGRIFRYQVSEIGDPIPVAGATADETARAAAYQAPSDQAKLTLITGWPDFSDTHYLFVVADLIGELE